MFADISVPVSKGIIVSINDGSVHRLLKCIVEVCSY